jgi:UDP-N-acetylmuramate dehydrogenase
LSVLIDCLLQKLSIDQIKTNESMKMHTSFKTGGDADYFITPDNIDELKYVLECCKNKNISYYVIGNGSNLLVGDKGFRGAIIQINKNMNGFTVDKEIINAYAGITLARLATIALENNLTGFEFASGIPGTLGGALCMNAGAYGGEMKQVVLDATLMDKSGDIITLDVEKLDLAYRSSIISKENWIVISCRIGLKLGNPVDIKKTMDELTLQRKTKQPLELPSAGSTFKRPEGYFASKLIMDCGLKGFSVGGAQVSDKHCGFIVNKSGATSKDIMDLIQYVQKTVKEKFEVEIEPEVKMIGDF